MIVSVTMNPSVDISYQLREFKLNEVNRVSDVFKTAGGKGLNVARVIHLLHSPVIATGILGGTIGDYIEKKLNEDSIRHDFLKTNQESRNCIAILHDGSQTEILESGPTFSNFEKDQFINHFTSLLERAEVITISGSLPKGLDAGVYTEMIRLAHLRKIPVILDCSGKLLKDVLDSHGAKPNVIKPNIDELIQLLGCNVSADDAEGLKKAVSDSLFNGVEYVVVSLGAKGAFVKHHDEYYLAGIPKIEVVNPVGSGDSVVAGVAVALLQKKSTVDLIKTAMTTGVLNTMEQQTGFVDADKFDLIYNKIEVTKMEGTTW